VIERRPASRRVRVAISFVGLALGMLWWVAEVGEELPLRMSWLDLMMFAVAAAVMELLPIRLPSGRAVPTSLAVVGAAAVMGASPPVVALISGVGWALARLLDRGSAAPGPLLLRIAGGWSLAGAAAVGVVLGPTTWMGTVDVGAAASLNLGAAVAIGFAIVIGAPSLDVIAHVHIVWRFAFRRIAEAVSQNVFIGASVASTAVLGALVHPVLGQWTLPTMLIPLFAARVGLDRLALGRRAYDQTIRAMSRLPEQLGTITSDHGIRVGRLAGEVALELGLDAGSVGDVIRAAHLHELGRIKLERDAPAARRELAVAGAAVIREVAALDRVAGIVELHGDLSQATPGDTEFTLPARIVAACCELDRYAPDPTEPGQRHEVAVRLVREVGDLDVVAALTRIVDRDGFDPTGR
jgi:hypothetical protein